MMPEARRTAIPFFSVELRGWVRLSPRDLRGLRNRDLHARAVDFHRQYFPTGLNDGSLNTLSSFRLDQQDHAASTARAADFAGQRAFTATAIHDAVNRSRRDGREVTLAKGPFFAHEAAYLAPVGAFEGAAKKLRDFRDAREVGEHFLVAVDVRAKHVPIIDGGFAGLAGIAEHDSALELGEIDAQFGAALTAGRQLDGRSSAKRRWIMILCAGGDVNNDGFGVTADVNPIGFALARSGVAVERRADGYGHGAGTTDARARGRFRIGGQRETAARLKEFHNFREQRQAIPFSFDQAGEGLETFFALGVAGQ